MRILRDFFEQPTLEVAEKLLGNYLHFNNHKIMITELEAYVGFDDPASHAARGVSARNQVMFGEAGFSYVYLIYGIYHCFNIVTETEGFPAALLIRGGKSIISPDTDLSGPGKLCRELGINREHNNCDLINSRELFLTYNEEIQGKIIRSPRIGIKKGLDKLWRYNLVDIG